MSVRRAAIAVLAAGFSCALLPCEAPAQAAPLKIGVVMSYSGPGASLGRSVNAAIDAWMVMHHNTLGGRPVVLLRRDDYANGKVTVKTLSDGSERSVPLEAFLNSL